MSWNRATTCLAGTLLVGCSTSSLVDRSTSRPTHATPVPTTSLAAPRAASHPFLLHLPGIGGVRSIDQALVRGFIQGGFKGEVEIYDWTEGNEGIPALRNTDQNKREAKMIADRLVARYHADPSSPIYLTCHSGGAGLAVWALEDLPADVRVQSLLFMSPALSPTYDLTKALGHVAGHAYVFSSLSDNLVLGYGTRMFGTIDGVNTDAAGRVGFIRPPTASVQQYGKLISLPYNPDWSRYHNLGDHVGGMTRAFSIAVLTPLLLSGILPPMPDLPITPGNSPHLPGSGTLRKDGRGVE